MRIRLALLLVVAVVPAVASAQVGRRGTGPRTAAPPRPAEKPPILPGIAENTRRLQYRLSRFSYDQYTAIMGAQTTGVLAEGIPTSYTMFGDGSRVAFRLTPSVSLSADMVSTYSGAPFSLGSLEFGVRVMPWTAYRVRPFADARMSYAHTTSSGGASGLLPIVFYARAAAEDLTTGGGHGGLMGIGAETDLGARFTLSTTLSGAHYAMTKRDLRQGKEWGYKADVYRLGIGIRFAPGRWYDAR